MSEEKKPRTRFKWREEDFGVTNDDVEKIEDQAYAPRTVKLYQTKIRLMNQFATRMNWPDPLDWGESEVTRYVAMLSQGHQERNVTIRGHLAAINWAKSVAIYDLYQQPTSS